MMEPRLFISRNAVQRDTIGSTLIRTSPKTLYSTRADTMESSTNTYQIAGLDDLGRGFNRQAEMKFLSGTFQAIFRYERFLLETEPQITEQAAVTMLIDQLQNRGYTQLRSRLQFQGKAYLGNQEPWEEHHDPENGGRLSRLFHALRIMFRRGRANCAD